MSIGSKIKEARINLGLTQEELAKNIGATKGAIANYKNGVSTPKVELLFKLFTALNCDANYLYQDYISNMDISKSNNKTKQIIDLFEMLSPKYKQYALKQMSLLLGLQNYTPKESD